MECVGTIIECGSGEDEGRGGGEKESDNNGYEVAVVEKLTPLFFFG